MAAATAQSVEQLVKKYTKPGKSNKTPQNLYNIPETKLRPEYNMQDALSTMIDNLMDEYARNPNEALETCFKTFGRERFQNSLRIYIHRHVAKVALQLAVKREFQREVK